MPTPIARGKREPLADHRASLAARRVPPLDARGPNATRRYETGSALRRTRRSTPAAVARRAAHRRGSAASGIPTLYAATFATPARVVSGDRCTEGSARRGRIVPGWPRRSGL